VSADGVIVVDKPAGVTSHDVVDEVRRRLRTRRVGHAGTLDPDATGVLVVGVGRATRFLRYAQSAPKRYAAVARFGITTATQDASGEVLEKRRARIRPDDVVGVLDSLTGEIEQLPPMVSALKVKGERLYKKARRGEDVDRPARRVTVYALAMTGFEEGDHPAATLDVRCSAGTYVRTLVNDLGERLGCGAHLETLRRVEAGGFSIEEAIGLDDVTPAALRPLVDAVGMLTRVEVGPGDAALVRDGRPFADGGDLSEGEAAAVVAGGDLLAVYRRAGARLVAERVVGR
jgi:tRNA pseudouridine55 synthase